MMWQMNLFTPVLLFSAFISGAIAYYATRQKRIVGSQPFAYLMLAITLWAGAEAIIVFSTQLSVKLLVTKIQYLGILPTPVLWLVFAIHFSGRARWLTHRNLIALFCIPVLVLLAVWTNEFHSMYYLDFNLVRSGSLLLANNTPGVFYWIGTLYSYLVFTMGTIMLIRVFFTQPSLYRAQIGLVILGALIPLVGNLIYNFGFKPRLGIDLTPLLFVLTGVTVGWGLFRFRFLGLSPIARELVVENLSDGMLVLDDQNRIVDINPAMETLLQNPASKLIGQTADDVFGLWADPKERFWEHGDFETEIVSERDGTQIDYHVQVSGIKNRQGKVTGRLILLRDITKTRQATSELERYAIQNAELLAEEYRQRQIVESLRQTMMILSSSLDHNAIVDAILAQLRKVLPYYSAGVFLQQGEELNLVRVVGPEAITGKYYSTPRRIDQVRHALKTRRAEVFQSTYTNNEQNPEDSEDYNEAVYSSMASPLVMGEELLGVLTIDRFELLPYTQDDADILRAFANQAAIAIKNAELYQQAKTAAVIQERNRLAQELHDAVNQTLFTASIMAEALPQVWEKDPEQGYRGLKEIQQLTRGALAEMRTLLLELRPQAITEKTFGDLMSHLTKAVSSRTRIPIDIALQNDAILPPDVQVSLYRIAQETFNNIVKHSEASFVKVFLDIEPENASIVIEDNGLGFEIDEILLGHLGLEIMRERARNIGADLVIISQPNHGTRIEAIWPVRESEK
jgi:PAS domain S-box-containing protein